VLPWIVRLLSLGVAMPVITAGALGGFMGVLWLRYRGPDAHESMLGPLGKPVVAGIAAIALLVAAALVQSLLRSAEVLTQIAELVSLGVLAVIALVWLRRIIHLGLLQESLEIAIGPDITCANCSKLTPSHTYCGECGVSLRALPKSRGHAPTAPVVGDLAASSAVSGDVAAPHEVRSGKVSIPPGSEGVARAAVAGPASSGAHPAGRGWLGPQRLLIVFAVLLGAVTVVALVVAFVISQGLDQPECEGDIAPCGAAVTGPLRLTAADRVTDAPFPALERYTDPSGFSFEYDPAIWTVSQTGAGAVMLDGFNGALVYLVETAPVGTLDDQGVFNARRDILGRNLLGFQLDREPARLLLGTAILGHHPGLGALFGGTLDSPQGPSQDIAVALVAAQDDTLAAVATIIVPATARDVGLQLADTINNTFTWPSDPVVQ
jgi:hypothetical protein